MQLAFPFILLAIVVVAVLGARLVNVILVLGIGSWVPYLRIVRGQVLSARNQEYVIGAGMNAARDPAILFHHLLPNMIAPASMVTVLSINLIGQWLPDFLDPRLRHIG